MVVLARHGGNGDTDTSPGMGASVASAAESVSVLADADQLESLARLRFEPRQGLQLLGVGQHRHGFGLGCRGCTHAGRRIRVSVPSVSG